MSKIKRYNVWYEPLDIGISKDVIVMCKSEDVEKLEEENKKLREALQFIAEYSRNYLEQKDPNIRNLLERLEANFNWCINQIVDTKNCYEAGILPCLYCIAYPNGE